MGWTERTQLRWAPGGLHPEAFDWPAKCPTGPGSAGPVRDQHGVPGMGSPSYQNKALTQRSRRLASPAPHDRWPAPPLPRGRAAPWPPRAGPCSGSARPPLLTSQHPRKKTRVTEEQPHSELLSSDCALSFVSFVCRAAPSFRKRLCGHQRGAVRARGAPAGVGALNQAAYIGRPLRGHRVAPGDTRPGLLLGGP